MTEVEVYRPRTEVAVPVAHDTDSWVQVVSDVIKMSNVIYDTPFVPDGLRGSAPAVAAAILAGREMGIGPMTSLQHIHVIKGKPAQSALLMRALIQSAGHKWEDGDVTDTRAVVRGCRRGESSWTEVTFTADQAKRAGIELGKYPADKLYARATSRLARRKFADVIAGMPYTAEDLEDGDLADDGEAAVVPAAEPDKPRTAQRKRAQTSPPAPAAPPSSPGATPTPGAERAGGDLPPLPGEEDAPGPDSVPSPAGPGAPDETDYDTPGTVTTGKGGQLTAIWTIFTSVFEFSNEEKEQARMVCAHIIGHDLESTTHLSRNEAKAILDTLSHWQKQADGKGEHPRTYMISVMVAGDGEPR